MKRKLIDLKDLTFNALSLDAAASGTSLKKYIENMLDEKASLLKDGANCQYRFSSNCEPSDRELAAIMTAAAEAATRTKRRSMAAFYANIRQSVIDAEGE